MFPGWGMGTREEGGTPPPCICVTPGFAERRLENCQVGRSIQSPHLRCSTRPAGQSPRHTGLLTVWGWPPATTGSPSQPPGEKPPPASSSIADPGVAEPSAAPGKKPGDRGAGEPSTLRPRLRPSCQRGGQQPNAPTDPACESMRRVEGGHLKPYLPLDGENIKTQHHDWPGSPRFESGKATSQTHK